MLLLDSFGIKNRFFLVICEAFGPEISALVFEHLLIVMIFLHLVKMVVLNQLLAILLFQIALCLIIYLVLGQLFVNRLSQLICLLLLIKLAHGDFFLMAK